MSASLALLLPLLCVCTVIAPALAQYPYGVIIGVAVYPGVSACYGEPTYQLFVLDRCDNLHGTGASLLVRGGPPSSTYTLYNMYECDPSAVTKAVSYLPDWTCTSFGSSLSVALFGVTSVNPPASLAGFYQQVDCTSPTTPSVTCASVLASSYQITQTGNTISLAPTSAPGTIYDYGLVAVPVYDSAICYGALTTLNSGAIQLNLDCFTTSNAQPRLEAVYVCASSSLPTTLPPAPTPIPTVAWGGSYHVDGGCDKDDCCCLSGTVGVTQSLLSLTFDASLAGQCDGVTTETGYATLASLSSTSVSFSLYDQQFTATKDGETITMENLDYPQCSGKGKCVSGACYSGSSNHGPSKNLLIIGIPLLLLVVGVCTLSFYYWRKAEERETSSSPPLLPDGCVKGAYGTTQ